MRVASDLKGEHIRRYEFNSTDLDEIENAQNRFSLQANAEL